MNRFHHVRIKLESFLNNLSLKKKLRYLYFLCILVPIVLTDIVILHALTKNEHAEAAVGLGKKAVKKIGRASCRERV